MKWQPIDTAPKDGRYVMTYRSVEPHFEPMYFTHLRHAGAKWCWFDGDYPAMQPTHWMPLPEPPVENDDRQLDIWEETK